MEDYVVVVVVGFVGYCVYFFVVLYDDVVVFGDEVFGMVVVVCCEVFY